MMINIPLIKHAPMTAFPQITSSWLDLCNSEKYIKSNQKHKFISLCGEFRTKNSVLVSRKLHYGIYLCFFPHNVTRKTNDLLVDPVLVELEIIWFEEQKITRTYKKGLLKKLIKSNITGDNEKIAKTILCLFSFLLTCFNNLIVVCLGMIFTIINKTKSTLSYF